MCAWVRLRMFVRALSCAFVHVCVCVCESACVFVCRGGWGDVCVGMCVGVRGVGVGVGASDCVCVCLPGAKLPKPILAIISPSSMGSSLGGGGPRLFPFSFSTSLGGGGPRLGPFTVFEEDFAGIKASSPRSGGPLARARAAGAPAPCCPRIACSSAWSSSLSLPRRGIETANVKVRAEYFHERFPHFR